MKFVVCAAVLVLHLVLLLTSVKATEQLQFIEEWILWKTEHHKSYSGEQDEIEKHSVWMANREFVINHNANWPEHGYSLALNQFADLVSMLLSILT